MEKVPGKNNIAGSLTKHVDGLELSQHAEWINSVIKIGRHEIMPDLSTDMGVPALHGEKITRRASD